jgi:anti-sigma factor RsiW
MNESEYQSLIEASWRRPLTIDEQARLDSWLATRPGAQADAEAELALSLLLGQLPNAPIASNFTAQVMHAVAREQAAMNRQPTFMETVKRWLRVPAPKLAWALGLIALGWFGVYQHQANVREDMAKGLTVMANVASLSDPSALEDFDAISRLNTSDDDELFAVLTAK